MSIKTPSIVLLVPSTRDAAPWSTPIRGERLRPGPCGYAIASRDLSDPVTLPPGDAVSAEIPPEWPGARVAALTLTDVLVSNFIVNAEIRDTNTNQIIAILIGLLAPPTRRGTPALFDLQDPVD